MADMRLGWQRTKERRQKIKTAATKQTEVRRVDFARNKMARAISQGIQQNFMQALQAGLLNVKTPTGLLGCELSFYATVIHVCVAHLRHNLLPEVDNTPSRAPVREFAVTVRRTVISMATKL